MLRSLNILLKLWRKFKSFSFWSCISAFLLFGCQSASLGLQLTIIAILHQLTHPSKMIEIKNRNKDCKNMLFCPTYQKTKVLLLKHDKEPAIIRQFVPNPAALALCNLKLWRFSWCSDENVIFEDFEDVPVRSYLWCSHFVSFSWNQLPVAVKSERRANQSSFILEGWITKEFWTVKRSAP